MGVAHGPAIAQGLGNGTAPCPAGAGQGLGQGQGFFAAGPWLGGQLTDQGLARLAQHPGLGQGALGFRPAERKRQTHR